MSDDSGPLDVVIGENVRRLRTEQGISQEELARRVANVTGTAFRQQAVLRTERGERPLRFAEASAIAEILGVPLTVLTEPQKETRKRYSFEVHRQNVEREVENLAPALMALGAAYESVEQALRAIWEAVAAVPEEDMAAAFAAEQWRAIGNLISPDHRERLRATVFDTLTESTHVSALGPGFAREFGRLTPLILAIEKRNFDVERKTWDEAAKRRAAREAGGDA